jgi:hypothetical protein
MNSCEQVLWANDLRTDEVVPSWEIKNQCNLLNAIFLDAVEHQLEKIRKRKILRLRSRSSKSTKTRLYHDVGRRGMDNVRSGSSGASHHMQHTVSKQFVEATQVMKLDPHNEVIEHFKNLTKDLETAADFIKDLKDNSCLSEYQNILGYLKYWSKEH